MTTLFNGAGVAPLTNGDSDDLELRSAGFSQSLVRDLTAISSVVHELDRSSVSEFIDYVGDCKGQIFLSGIGKYWILKVFSTS